jgi:alkaline phosphatase
MALLAALGTATAGLVVGTTTDTVSAGPPEFRLQLLHASDLEGGVDAIGRAPNFAAIIDALEDAGGMDASVTVSAGDNVIPGPFFAAASDTSIQPTLNTVFNTFYGLPNMSFAAYNDLRAAGGRIDYSIMNVIEFDASALGNHEFDLGSEVLATNIKSDLRGAAGPPADRWMGVQFPYLSANLNFSGDTNLSNAFTTDLRTTASFADAPAGTALPPDGAVDRIAPNALYEDDSGELIGIVGATTPILQTISSPTGTTVIGPTTDDMPALAAVLQPAIDEVIAAGANKVILTSHLQQVALESQLATLLDGVDVIIAGGSDTILANGDDVLLPGATPAGSYPLVTQSSTGEPVAIVSTDGEYTYVGRLVVDFDADGILVAPDGTPLDAVGDLDAALNGPIAATEANANAAWGGAGAFDPGTKGQLVQQLVNSVTGVVTAKDSQVFGETEVFIDGRRSEVRTQETTAGNLSADANLYIARLVDPTVQVSIKNGGGIRAEIGEVVNDGSNTLLLPPQANPLSGKLEGQISQLDIENSLRFNNSLTMLTTTAAGLKELVEHAVAATAPGATPGQFPQIGGMAFSFDPSRQARTASVPGQRVRTLVVGEGPNADVVVVNGNVVGNPTRPIRVVTLGFLADPIAAGSPNGGDNYPFPAVTVPGSRVNLSAANVPAGVATFAQPGTEQDAFAEFLAQFHGIGDGTPFDDADTPPSGDLRIQNLSARDDTVLKSVRIFSPRPPVRVLDTRNGLGFQAEAWTGTTAVPAGETVEIPVGGVLPAGADAAIVNLTVTRATQAGFITAHSCDVARPETSNANFTTEGDVANLAVVPLSATGSFCLYTSATTDLVVDVFGSTSVGYTSTSPTRLADTRTGTQPAAGSTTRVAIPAGSAQIVSVTATEATAAGFFSVHDCAIARPETSIVNYGAASDAANTTIVEGGTELCVYTSASADVVVDLHGTLLDAEITPSRLVDTRKTGTPVTPGATVELPALSGGSVAFVNITATETTSAGFYTIHECGTTPPVTSNLNARVGRDVANLAAVPTSGRTCVTAFINGHLVVDLVATTS